MANHVCKRAPHDMAIAFAQALDGVAHHELIAHLRLLGGNARFDPVVIDKAGDAWFAVDISGETVSRTVPGRWAVGTRLNLEPAMKLGDELGGHIVGQRR